MKIALLESHIEWEDKEKNISMLTHILEQVKEEKLNAIFLPEMSFTGFSMNTQKTGETTRNTVTKMKKLSKEQEITIGFGWVKNTDDKSENHYSIVSNGLEILDYTKLHPFSYSDEDRYFRGGEEICCERLLDFSVGTLICYDLRFPEVFQILSKKADLILIPANFPQKRSEHWKILLKARAIENQCYIAGINCTGEMDGLFYSGDSGIYNPNGDLLKPIKTLTFGESSLYIYEIENDVADFRDAFPVKQDRRESSYRNMFENE